MQYKVAFCDKEGKEYGVLDNIDENTTLSKLRIQGAKNLNFVPTATSYSFVWKDTPISLRQENMFTVGKYADGKYGEDQTLKIILALSITPKATPKAKESKNKQPSASGATINHSPPPNSTTKSKKVKGVNTELEPCKLSIFSENDLSDPSISRMEKERICFWNSLSAKIDSHEVYKDWNLQARRGIVDTEWTLKKTELLKIDADVVLKNIDCINETRKHHAQAAESQSAKKITENLDRLLQTDSRRKSCYKKIEDLHKNLKSSSADRHKIEEQIAQEEDVLHKIFTELKTSQSALEMAITRSPVCQADNDTADLESSVDSNLTSMTMSALTEDEIMDVVTSTMDDFNVEYDYE